jgi:hypothetical protein
MTNILNTNDREVEMQEPFVELDEVDPAWDGGRSTVLKLQDRERYILAQRRLEYLNVEEEKSLVRTRLDYKTQSICLEIS